MNTRMEDVAVDVALTALQSVCTASEPPLDPEALKEAFRARWPTEGSHRPMNDAIAAAAQAASSCFEQDYDSWHSTISKSWQPAVEEVIEQYLKAARHSFKESHHIQGAETLTDAVRATMGCIAATRNWPHHSHDNLYAIAAALGSGRDWPNTLEEFDRALENSTEEGDQLGSALGASMGLPGSLRFGSYCDNPEDAEENGFSFAESTIELARRLANGKVP